MLILRDQLPYCLKEKSKVICKTSIHTYIRYSLHSCIIILKKDSMYNPLGLGSALH